jgi:hypothetical protein
MLKSGLLSGVARQVAADVRIMLYSSICTCGIIFLQFMTKLAVYE